MRVLPIPCRADNYAYLLVQDGQAVVVDPSDAAPVLAALEGYALRAIWCTHHHADHVDGVSDVRARHPGVPVLGSRSDQERGRIPEQTVGLDDGDLLRFGDHTGRVLAVPGHTAGALAYQIGDALFTGDTLFCGGCGRLFEGTPSQMRSSLERLRLLDPALRVWCGHEYTVRNLEFAVGLAREPAAERRLAAARETRARRAPTVGAPLADEIATNPFLRWDAPAVQAAAGALGAAPDDADAVFAAIRAAKDRW